MTINLPSVCVDVRQAEATKIREKHPDRVPVSKVLYKRFTLHLNIVLLTLIWSIR